MFKLSNFALYFLKEYKKTYNLTIGEFNFEIKLLLITIH